MHVSPISSTDYGVSKMTKTQPAFGAVFLNNATIKNKDTGARKEVAIVELETEWRELLADLRLKHKKDVSAEEFQWLVDEYRANSKKIYDECMKVHARAAIDPINNLLYRDDVREAEKAMTNITHLRFEEARNERPETNLVETRVMDDLVKKSGEKVYKGDFEFMNQLAKESCEIADANQRVQERNLMTDSEGSTTSMGDYLKARTNGEREVMPRGGYGLLKKEYDEGLAVMPHTIDSIIWTDQYLPNNAFRQRILMAVEPQADGNYRNLSPDTKIYGMAEIYTDRAMDVVEDMASEHLEEEEKRMAELIKEDKEYSDLLHQYIVTGQQDKELNAKLNEMERNICRKHNISYADWRMINHGKRYIYDVPEHEGKKALEKMNIPEENIVQAKIWKLFSTDWDFLGAEGALLDAIMKKARFCGIFTDCWVSQAINRCKDFQIIPGWNGEKMFKDGWLKPKKIMGVKIR